ncbi:hypothetical protein E2C01_102777 [Portunus trituberculatus]|uniref:Uncharacterized protein n=1 Tax=Portunus trituberculatus TaxID=210409 RepID=A0A5B7KI53_PORTR|nr:hypothetical protein [Portunus trituberculatus]
MEERKGCYEARILGGYTGSKGELEESIRNWSLQEKEHGSQAASRRGIGSPSAGEDEHRYKIQIVSQSQEGMQARAAIACLCLAHSTLDAHLHHLRLSPDPFCP